MNYMMLMYRDERAEDTVKGCEGLAEQLQESGHYRAGGILHPVSTATSLQMRDGQKLVTDGPFAETREQLAGYMIIEARDLDEALSIAARHPVARIGTVEIRPIAFIPDEIPAATT